MKDLQGSILPVQVAANIERVVLNWAYAGVRKVPMLTCTPGPQSKLASTRPMVCTCSLGNAKGNFHLPLGDSGVPVRHECTVLRIGTGTGYR